MTAHYEAVEAHAVAMFLIREAVGDIFGPVASLCGEDAVLQLYGPEPIHEAEAIIAGLRRIKGRMTMLERTERLKAVIIDLLNNADHNNEGWRKGMSLEELAGDMIAYADDAFTEFVELVMGRDGEQRLPDWDALEREIVAVLRQINLTA